jgi:Arc/MetJ family transcription regulator
MRTTIDLDEDLVRDTVKESGKKSKKAALEEAMREFVNSRRRMRLIERIEQGDLGIDLTLEELRKMRGCDA